MAITTKALQDFINATKTQLADITSQLTAINTRFTKDEAMISSIQATLKIPPNTDPCSGVATVSDSLSHPPPTSGAQAYNSMVRPALGASYQDSVFCKTVIRLTDIGAIANEDQNYTFHAINADRTLFFHKHGQTDICAIPTGSVIYANQPVGLSSSEIRWSMTDPDKYYFWNGTILSRRNLAAQTTTTIKDFGATLQAMGGSHNYQDKTDRYFIVMYGDTAKVWDSQTNTIYANPIAPLPAVANATVTISPSGNNILTWASADAEPNKLHYAYAINHGTQSISTSPVQWWGIGTSHAAIVSASDGKDYAIIEEDYAEGAVYRCDLTVSCAGLTDAQQRAAQYRLLLDPSFNAYHFANVSVGSLQDWCFISYEEFSTDNFNQVPSSWYPRKSEIVAVNVITGVCRRLAHHRSRGLAAGYYPQPKPSCDPKGVFVLWSSNMNISTPAEYCDLYGIANPLTS